MTDVVRGDEQMKILCGDAATVMAEMPAGSVDLIVTSPPYWQGDNGDSYAGYLEDLQTVWSLCARVLRPNGKLCINAPCMPIPKKIIKQHTRHLKNIAFDIEHRILAETDLERYSLFIWQKQTSKLMFGSYPHPGNLIENNTVEFINVYVKPGKPPKFAADVKAASKFERTEWIDLIQQVWFMYPQDVKRAGHPAPFPPKLPGRLIKMYAHTGEIVLDLPSSARARRLWSRSRWAGASSASISIRDTSSSPGRMSPRHGRAMCRCCWSVTPNTRARMNSPRPATAARKRGKRSTSRGATASGGPMRKPLKV
jgi:DNA modification methylase